MARSRDGRVGERLGDVDTAPEDAIRAILVRSPERRGARLPSDSVSPHLRRAAEQLLA